MMPDRREFVKLLCATSIGGALMKPLKLLGAEQVPAPRIEPGPIVVPRAGLSGFATGWNLRVDTEERVPFETIGGNADGFIVGPPRPPELGFTMLLDNVTTLDTDYLKCMAGKRVYLVCEGD